MSVLNKFHTLVARNSTAKNERGTVDDPSALQVRADDKEAGPTIANEVASDEAKPTENAQEGVKKIEAVTLAWGKGSVFTILILYILPLLSQVPISVVQLANMTLPQTVSGFSPWSIISRPPWSTA